MAMFTVRDKIFTLNKDKYCYIQSLLKIYNFLTITVYCDVWFGKYRFNLTTVFICWLFCIQGTQVYNVWVLCLQKSLDRFEPMTQRRTPLITMRYVPTLGVEYLDSRWWLMSCLCICVTFRYLVALSMWVTDIDILFSILYMYICYSHLE